MKIPVSISICLAVLSAGAVRADESAEKTTEKPPAAKTARSVPAAPVTDVCKKAVDPYDFAGEKMRFFKAAGVDNELDSSEFEADRARTGGFARKFDSFPAMLRFDKDRSRTLDWFEADTYRRELRKKVLAEYDDNRNRRLDGEERLAASRALLSGKFSSRTHSGSSRKWSSGKRGSASSENAWAAISKGSGNGGSGASGTQGMSPYKRKMLSRWDKNNDGELGDDEKAAMEQETAERNRRMEAYKAAKTRIRAECDADGDGNLDREERKAYGRAMREFYILQRYDKDGDGALSEEETAVLERDKAEKERRAQQMREARKKIREQCDADGDGKLNKEERDAYRRGMKELYLVQRYDRDGDGVLSDEERAAMGRKSRSNGKR